MSTIRKDRPSDVYDLVCFYHDKPAVYGYRGIHFCSYNCIRQYGKHMRLKRLKSLRSEKYNKEDK